VFHYKETFKGNDPDPEKLFNGYVNTFLKIKIEASGYPTGVSTDDEKNAYIEEIWVNEGIRLDKDEIKLNPALRTLAKLFLNSLYGYEIICTIIFLVYTGK
jgi:hypothetical protein